MITALTHLLSGISSIWNNIHESEETKYRREMTKFLNQATDILHLEQLEREWERLHGRRYW